MASAIKSRKQKGSLQQKRLENSALQKLSYEVSGMLLTTFLTDGPNF